MVNKSKAIGTHAETAVVNYLRTHGFAGAERRALAGSLDKGDILVGPGFILEIKSGKAAESASDNQILAWLAEAEVESRNSDGASFMLVTKRKAIGITRVGQWWAHMRLDHWLDEPESLGLDLVIHVALADAVTLARRYGFGDPLSAADGQSWLRT